MRISSEQIGHLLEARLARLERTSMRETEARERQPDLVSFSAQGDTIRVAMAAAQGASPFRDEGRLAELESQVKAGSYRIAGEAIAEALLAQR